MGVECAVIPTAVLSTHTGGFKGWTFRDLSDDIPKITEHWQREGLKFDGVYTGYLGSPEQAEMIENFVDEFAPPLVGCYQRETRRKRSRDVCQRGRELRDTHDGREPTA